MRTKLYIIALLSAIAVLVNAQDWNTRSINDPAIQSQQIIKGGATYDGMVYQPFDNTLPSEQVPVGTEETGQQRNNQNGIRKGFDIGGDAGQGPSPLGDAVLPLLLLALAFGGYVYLRKQRALNR